jgi:sulfate/thiosulfate transport system permease protein
MTAKWGLRTLALGYLGLLLLAPVGMIFYKTFEHGLGPPIDAMTSPDALHAIWLTLLMVAVAVPLNAVFGVARCCSSAINGRATRCSTGSSTFPLRSRRS